MLLIRSLVLIWYLIKTYFNNKWKHHLMDLYLLRNFIYISIKVFEHHKTYAVIKSMFSNLVLVWQSVIVDACYCLYFCVVWIVFDKFVSWTWIIYWDISINQLDTLFNFFSPLRENIAVCPVNVVLTQKQIIASGNLCMLKLWSGAGMILAVL